MFTFDSLQFIIPPMEKQLERKFEPAPAYAQNLDKNDELAAFRERFYQIEGYIYMDGNSLGLCSTDAETAVLDMLRAWKENGIFLWNINDGRYFRYTRILAELAAPLLGVSPEEICFASNTTINIHKAISTFYKPTPGRYKILVDDLNFPSDIYAVHSQVLLKGYEVNQAVKVVTSKDGRLIDEDDLIEAMTEDVALVLLSSVFYRSAQLLDINRLSAEARKRGIIIGWDLCHSIGAVPHDLTSADPDFAVWCNYKYLSGGPGCPAGLYINRRNFEKMPGLWGWWGNNPQTQFQMSHNFEKASDAGAWQTGTPNLLALAPLEGVLRIYSEAGMKRIREKSLNLTAYLMFLIDEKLNKYGFSYANPKEGSKRGGHVALTHTDAYRICMALKNRKVIPDFRDPDIIRLAPVALYNSYSEVYETVEILEKIAISKEYEAFGTERGLVV